MIIRKFGVVRRRGRRILFQQVHHHFDSLFQLRIVARAHSLRIVFHVNIGSDAVILHVPGPVGSVEGQVGRASETAIQQIRGIRVVADEATPGAFADERTDLCS